MEYNIRFVTSRTNLIIFCNHNVLLKSKYLVVDLIFQYSEFNSLQ